MPCGLGYAADMQHAIGKGQWQVLFQELLGLYLRFHLYIFSRAEYAMHIGGSLGKASLDVSMAHGLSVCEITGSTMLTLLSTAQVVLEGI